MITAEDFAELNQYDLECYDEGGYQGIEIDSFAQKLIEFAKLHVEAAKKEYLQQGFGRYMENAFDKYPIRIPIDEDSILNAYPLTLIK